VFDDDDVWQRRQALDATWHAMVVKAAEANTPGQAATLTPSTSLTHTIKLVTARPPP